jgi:hypothetical protein
MVNRDLGIPVASTFLLDNYFLRCFTLGQQFTSDYFVTGEEDFLSYPGRFEENDRSTRTGMETEADDCISGLFLALLPTVS